MTNTEIDKLLAERVWRYLYWLPEWMRWKIASYFNDRMKHTCWVAWVEWARGEEYPEDMNYPWSMSVCIKDAQNNGTCYCGKLDAAALSVIQEETK